MFCIVANGEVELDAEIPETRLSAVQVGQPARLEVAGVGEVTGAPRLARNRQAHATGPRAHLSGRQRRPARGLLRAWFNRNRCRRGLALPLTAVLFGSEGPLARLIRNNRVETRKISVGLAAGSMVEIRAGLSEGDLVVTRSGTFLRDGGLVRPVPDKTS
jgi:HlyD family secretion protein